MAASTVHEPKCKRLVLDAGPLLSLSPLRGLSETFYTVPQVLSELKDSRAREHFERLGLMSGVKVEVRSPDAASLSHVIQWAKKTGDYSVLSHPDLCVIALAYALHEEEREKKEQEKGGSDSKGFPSQESQLPTEELSSGATQEAPIVIENLTELLGEISFGPAESQTQLELTSLEEIDVQDGDQDAGPLGMESAPIHGGDSLEAVQPLISSERQSPCPIYDDPSDSDDGEGEWITPDNVALHKSRALNLLPQDGVRGGKAKAKAEPIDSGCMTADFAMQNVLLQMGLNLIGLEGKRIEKVKSWVLRCHACFKICKDHSKKFCPSCGNPTLLRASVTVAAPGASADAPAMQVHLKSNFQYKIRGTKYSIPSPKPGSAKTGPGTGLILREDQVEYMRAKKRADGKREREEDKLLNGLITRAADGRGGAAVGSWMDPDWVPEIISIGSGGKGRTVKNSRMDGDMPQVGYGRKNPNEKRRKK